MNILGCVKHGDRVGAFAVGRRPLHAKEALAWRSVTECAENATGTAGPAGHQRTYGRGRSRDHHPPTPYLIQESI